MPRDQVGGAMYDGFGDYFFLADGSETYVLQDFQGFAIIFLGRPLVHSQKCSCSQWVSTVFWETVQQHYFPLARAPGSSEIHGFSNGFVWFCSISIRPDHFSWQARSGIVCFYNVF